MKNSIIGARAALSGFSWIMRPQIRRFVLIPLLINIMLFVLAFAVLGHYAESWVTGAVGDKASWWLIFRWTYDFIVPILTGILYVAMTLVVYFGFSTMANLIAAPFNARLSQAVEQRLCGNTVQYQELPILKEILISIKSELAKITRFIIMALGLLLLLFIPGVNLLFPVIWFVFMAYNLASQYLDYPMSNHQISHKEQRAILKQYSGQRLGFGCVANALLLIPVVNFIAMPVCVCGATVLWNEQIKNK